MAKNRAVAASNEVVTNAVWKYPFSPSETPSQAGALPSLGLPSTKPMRITTQMDIAIPRVTR